MEMFDFYQKRKLRNIVNSRYTQGLILVFTLWVGWSAYTRYEIAMDMKERRIQAEEQVATLKVHKDELVNKVEYASSERGIEAEMRKQFDVALPGEQVVVIVEDDEGLEIQPLSSTTTEPEKKWYEFWR